MQPPPQVTGRSVFSGAQPQLVGLGSQFRQKPSELISNELLLVWDLGVDGIVLSG